MGEVVDGERESGRAVLGRTLRFLREKEGKSLGQLAEDTGYDKSYLSRLEKGDRLSKPAVMEDLDSYYGCGDLLVRHWGMRAGTPSRTSTSVHGRWRRQRKSCGCTQPDVPGLLQTRGVRPGGVVWRLRQRQATAMKSRNRWPRAWGGSFCCARIRHPDARFIMDESALRRPSANTEIWEDQLLHIVAVAAVAERRDPGTAVLGRGAPPHGEGVSDSALAEDGSAVAYTEGDGCGLLTDDPEAERSCATVCPTIAAGIWRCPRRTRWRSSGTYWRSTDHEPTLTHHAAGASRPTATGEPTTAWRSPTTTLA